jgi:uncharacterized damage-inducible protein DinB
MKKFGIILLALMFVGFGLNELKLSDEERSKAMDHLSQTRDNLLSIIEGLSEEQLTYKANPESWSIAECVEHIAISENNIIEMVSGAVQVTADASKRSEVTISDEQLLGMITDRSNKVKTSEAFEPSGKFGSYEETLEAFTSKRQENIDYIQNTEDDLRNHYAQLPMGTVDAYQVVLFMSGHTERHTKQIEEVMANPGFPGE